jgi:hypothetical protein
MKHFYYAAFAVFLFLCSCGPMRVTTSVVKQYPVLEQDEPVEVYFSNQDIPTDSEALGLVKAFDSGMTLKCDSLTTVEHLKTEARKIGGNAVAVTEYIKPSFRRSSCHQMAGTIIRVHNFDSVFLEETLEQRASYIPEQKRTLPHWRATLDGGYAWRTAQLPRDNTRDFFQSMHKGLSFQGDIQYYFKDNQGVGLTYSAFTSGTGNKFYTKGETFIQYIGADYVFRSEFEKWVLYGSIGLGYAGYSITLNDGNRFAKEWGSTVGFRSLLGVDYRIDSSLAIGLNLSSISGLVYNINVNDNGTLSQWKADSPETAVGLGLLRITAGLRYYF